MKRSSDQKRLRNDLRTVRGLHTEDYTQSLILGGDMFCAPMQKLAKAGYGESKRLVCQENLEVIK